MLRPFLIAILVSLLCSQSCVGNRVGTTPAELGWQAWLLVDPERETSRPNNEGGKTRRITPKSVFIAPAFSGSSLPDCAEGYRADSMGRCVKLVQLNHAAQLDFLLQRLNAMYAAPVVHRPYDDLATASDSSSSGPLQVTIPIEIPPEPEDEPKESVEVAVVMADVLKDDQIKNNNKTKGDKSQTIVAVWNVGKNGSSVEEIESVNHSEPQSANLQKSDFVLATSNATKYAIIEDSESSATPKTRLSLMDDEELLSTAPSSVLLPEENSQNLSETVKMPSSAMALLEEVSDVSSENGRTGNTSRRNVSSDQGKKEEASAMLEEMYSTTTEALVRTVKNASMLIPNNNSSNVSRPEVQAISEIKKNVLHATTYRPNSFVRFPSDNNDNSHSHRNAISANRFHGEGVRHNFVKFPESHKDYSNQGPFLPTNVQHRPTFWWLPPGWRLDPTRHQPMLIRFWARMPLLRDPTYQHNMAVDSYNQDSYAGRRRRPAGF